MLLCWICCAGVCMVMFYCLYIKKITKILNKDKLFWFTGDKGGNFISSQITWAWSCLVEMPFVYIQSTKPLQVTSGYMCRINLNSIIGGKTLFLRNNFSNIWDL